MMAQVRMKILVDYIQVLLLLAYCTLPAGNCKMILPQARYMMVLKDYRMALLQAHCMKEMGSYMSQMICYTVQQDSHKIVKVGYKLVL